MSPDMLAMAGLYATVATAVVRKAFPRWNGADAARVFIIMAAIAAGLQVESEHHGMVMVAYEVFAAFVTIVAIGLGVYHVSTTQGATADQAPSVPSEPVVFQFPEDVADHADAPDSSGSATAGDHS